MHVCMHTCMHACIHSCVHKRETPAVPPSRSSAAPPQTRDLFNAKTSMISESLVIDPLAFCV